jgi:hypothetical protein
MPLQFPSRDFTDQVISRSYQDVVQHYTQDTASYFLDGLGNVLLFVTTSSLGQQILTVDTPVRFATSASYANLADAAIISDTSSLSVFSLFTNTSSLSFESIFSTTASVANYSNYSDTASYTINSRFALTASYAITSSYEMEVEISSSWASASISSSYALSSSYTRPTTHVEWGIISGSDFVGNPKIYNISYSLAFPNTIYIVSIIGDEPRAWSTANRSPDGFSINSNSNAPLAEMVMWRVEGER